LAYPVRKESVLRETLDLVRQHGSIVGAARKSGIPYGTFQARFRAAQTWAEKNGVTVPEHGQTHRAAPPVQPIAEGMSVEGDTAQVTRASHERVKTLADLIRVCEIDTNEWEVERWVANKWEMGSKDPDGDTRTTPLFQVKAWLKRKVVIIAVRDEIAAMVEEAKRLIRPRPIKRLSKPGQFMLEPSLPDLHVGKLAWGVETGHGDYDIQIAERVFKEALLTLIERTSHFQYARVVFPIGQDLLHADSLSGMTTKGTRLDTDSRYPKSFRAAWKLMAWAVETLAAEVAPVKGLIVPGNHDQLGAFTLGEVLSAYFHNTKHVTIDNQPRSRKYDQFGRNMLMWTHGDKGKKANYPLIMATEEPDMWAASTHREVHTGHIHQTQVLEFNGVRVRTSPALCAPDAWHAEHFFVGSKRGAEAFVFDQHEGPVCIATYTVPQEGTAA
jgi:hypothetical protein